MKICFLSLDYPSQNGSGGVGIFVQSIARWLADKGHEVTVLALKVPGEPLINFDAGVKIVRFSQGCWHRYLIRIPLFWRLSRPIRELERSWRGWEILKALNEQATFDVIEITETGGIFTSLMMNTVPVVVRLHGEPFTFYKYTPDISTTIDIKVCRFIQRIALRRAKLLIAPSRAHTLEIIDELGKKHPPILKIPNAVEYSEKVTLNGLENDDVSKNKIHPIVLYVGRLERAKGVPLLLTAARKVLESLPDTSFVLAGSYSHTLNKKDIDLLMARYDLYGKIIFLGQISRAKLLTWYRLATVCVLPSYYETFGIAALEAMTFGLPVVATRAGGLPELIDDERTGLLVPPGDDQELANALIRLLKDPSLRNRLGQEGQRSVAELYSLERVARMTMDAYGAVAGE